MRSRFSPARAAASVFSVLTTLVLSVALAPRPAAAACSIAPALGASPSGLCNAEHFFLDASASTAAECAGGLEYRFRDGANILQDWSPSATRGPRWITATTTFEVDVRCAAEPGCEASASVTLEVVEGVAADAGADADACPGQMVQLDGGGSVVPGCVSGTLFEWREGTRVVRAASPEPAWLPPTDLQGRTTYTLVVSCAGAPACDATDDVVVNVRSCPLAVRFDGFEATRGAGGTVVVSWRTAMEEGTIGFVVERATAEVGPFVEVAAVAAAGPGFAYSVTDGDAPADAAARFRVVELTTDGRGSATAVFGVSAPPTPAPASEARGGRARRGPGRR